MSKLEENVEATPPRFSNTETLEPDNTPRYTGEEPGALEAQQDLANFSRQHRVYPCLLSVLTVSLILILIKACTDEPSL